MPNADYHLGPENVFCVESMNECRDALEEEECNAFDAFNDFDEEEAPAADSYGDDSL